GRYPPRFTIVAARPTPPPAVFRKLLRFTSLLAFEPCLSPPERVQIRTASFLNAPVLQQVFQLAHELLYILKVHVHRREAHVRHFVECFQLLHDQLADYGGAVHAQWRHEPLLQSRRQSLPASAWPPAAFRMLSKALARFSAVRSAPAVRPS